MSPPPRENVESPPKLKVTAGECLQIMRQIPSDSVDLVFTSPPYEAARTYGIDFKLRGQEWVDWARERFEECVRISRGLVAWVVEGQTKDFRWSATPALLMADLHRAGVRLRKPPAFYRVGIPGSGGPDWWRNDYEFIVCASKGRLPWSDNTATGQPPKFKPGGAPSHRTKNGERVNNKYPWRKNPDGIRGEKRGGTPRYKPPAKANPGNVIKLHGGGGHIGNKLAHSNEAPFPEPLAEAFILSFCPQGGTVLDPFCGSGTVLDVASQHERKAIGIDIRESQVELTLQRVPAARKVSPAQLVGLLRMSSHGA